LILLQKKFVAAKVLRFLLFANFSTQILPFPLSFISAFIPARLPLFLKNNERIALRFRNECWLFL